MKARAGPYGSYDKISYLSPRPLYVARRCLTSGQQPEVDIFGFLNKQWFYPNFRVNLPNKSDDDIKPNKCGCFKAYHNMKRCQCNQCNIHRRFIDFIMAKTSLVLYPNFRLLGT